MVKERNPITVIILMMVTCGIYGLYWMIQTKNEINEKGGDIPTAWLIIIPIANFYWLWKYVEQWHAIAKPEQELMMVILVYLIFSPLAIYWIQVALNKLA